jgi:hypothetical protein
MSVRRHVVVAAVGVCIAILSGCASIPPLDNPVLVKPGHADPDSLIVTASSGPTPEGYAEVYERALDALDDYFEIVPGSRHGGVLKTYPKVAAGYEQPWKPSSPSAYERWLATFQSIRHYAIVRIDSVEEGFRVTVEVYRQQEVTPVPIQAIGGRGPMFRDRPTGMRMAEIVETPKNEEGQWQPLGGTPHRDFAFEQAILRKIQRPNGVK